MFNNIVEWFKSGGAMVKTIAAAIIIIMGFFAWDARYAKTIQVASDLQAAEQRTVQTIQSLKSNIDLNQDIVRLNNNVDMVIKMKMLMKSYPNDKDLKEEYETLVKEKNALQEKIKSCQPIAIQHRKDN